MFPPRFLATDGNHILGNALFTNQATADSRTCQTPPTSKPDGRGVRAPATSTPTAGRICSSPAGMNYPFRYRGNDVLLNEGGKRFANAEFVLGVEPRQRLVGPGSRSTATART